MKTFNLILLSFLTMMSLIATTAGFILAITMQSNPLFLFVCLMAVVVIIAFYVLFTEGVRCANRTDGEF